MQTTAGPARVAKDRWVPGSGRVVRGAPGAALGLPDTPLASRDASDGAGPLVGPLLRQSCRLVQRSPAERPLTGLWTAHAPSAPPLAPSDARAVAPDGPGSGQGAPTGGPDQWAPHGRARASAPTRGPGGGPGRAARARGPHGRPKRAAPDEWVPHRCAPGPPRRTAHLFYPAGCRVVAGLTPGPRVCRSPQAAHRHSTGRPQAPRAAGAARIGIHHCLWYEWRRATRYCG